MDRYIETQAIKEFTLHNPLTEEEWGMVYDWEFDRTNHVTFLTPLGKKVEFVKVVRCKDCKYRTKAEWSNRVYYCGYSGRDEFIVRNDYCSKGERKESKE